MLAEDEAELRDVLSLMLEDMEMKVLTAGNGNEALSLQENYDGDIDFLLTDIIMPQMDGAELGELFSTARPTSNVVYMSGYPFVEVPQGADFIPKPLKEDLVLAVLRRALQRRDERLEKGEISED